MTPQVLGAAADPGPQANGRPNLLAQTVVQHTEDAGLGNVGVAKERGLHFGAIDVLSTAQDHVLLAIDQENVPLRIDPGDITCSEPAIDDRLSAVRELVMRADPVHEPQTKRLVGVDLVGKVEELACL